VTLNSYLFFLKFLRYPPPYNETWTPWDPRPHKAIAVDYP